jgi:hypothetical protein
MGMFCPILNYFHLFQTSPTRSSVKASTSCTSFTQRPFSIEANCWLHVPQVDEAVWVAVPQNGQYPGCKNFQHIEACSQFRSFGDSGGDDDDADNGSDKKKGKRKQRRTDGKFNMVVRMGTLQTASSLRT